VALIPERIGRYRILERVGAGGMGVLYRAIDTVLDRDVAIKVMLADIAGEDDEMRVRFSREARAVAKLQHRNIVTVFELGEEGGTEYIVMEFLRGQSLAARIGTPPPLTLDEKVDIVAQLCAGLGYAHSRGIIHRDVKPANTFILTDGTVKLLDFGIAKVSDSHLTRMGATLGSVHYMSPEQIGGENIDARADVFSTGALLYELLAGQKPFDDPMPTTVLMKILNEEPVPLRVLAPDVPEALAAIVNRAMAKDPARRFNSAAEIERELVNLRRGLSQLDAMAAAAFVPETIDTAPTLSPANADAPTRMEPPTIVAPELIAEDLTIRAEAPAMPGPATTVAAPVARGPIQPVSSPPAAARPSRRVAWRAAVSVIALLVVGGGFGIATWLRRPPTPAASAPPAAETTARPATSPPATLPAAPAPTTPPATLPAAPATATTGPTGVTTTAAAPAAAAPLGAPPISAPPSAAPSTSIIQPGPTAGTSPGTVVSSAPEERTRQRRTEDERPVATSAKPETPSARPQRSPRCDSLIERQSLGEVLTRTDLEFLQRNCAD
jgi:serine/threonine-protein kinase